MEIKVTYQGVEKAVIDFQVFTTIALLETLGYRSFTVRSKVSTYDYFASFKNEDTEEYIYLYPDKSFMKAIDCRVSLKELNVIKEILDKAFSVKYCSNEESE